MKLEKEIFQVLCLKMFTPCFTCWLKCIWESFENMNAIPYTQPKLKMNLLIISVNWYRLKFYFWQFTIKSKLFVLFHWLSTIIFLWIKVQSNLMNKSINKRKHKKEKKKKEKGKWMCSWPNSLVSLSIPVESWEEKVVICVVHS